MKKIAYSKDALKTLTRMPANTARLIRSKIEQYASDPRSLANNVKALKGMDGYLRLRVNDWRVVFSETGEIIAIIKIAPRGGVYDQEPDMTEQIITTPGGERLVIIPEAEFLAMREAFEDHEDREAVRAFHRKFAAGEEELIPADIANRILDGENKVRVWRSHRGLSARDLAAAAGLSAPYISEIESGKKEGSLSAMKKIAEVLKVDLDDLV